MPTPRSWTVTDTTSPPFLSHAPATPSTRVIDRVVGQFPDAEEEPPVLDTLPCKGLGQVLHHLGQGAFIESRSVDSGHGETAVGAGKEVRAADPSTFRTASSTSSAGPERTPGLSHSPTRPCQYLPSCFIPTVNITKDAHSSPMGEATPVTRAGTSGAISDAAEPGVSQSHSNSLSLRSVLNHPVAKASASSREANLTGSVT